MADLNKPPAQADDPGLQGPPPADEADEVLSLRGWSGVPKGFQLGPWTEQSRSFLVEVRQEFAKISWPTRRRVVTETVVVLAVVVILTFTIVILDRVFSVFQGWLIGS